MTQARTVISQDVLASDSQSWSVSIGQCPSFRRSYTSVSRELRPIAVGVVCTLVTSLAVVLGFWLQQRKLENAVSPSCVCASH